MFTPNPPLDDDVRVLADLLWRYTHSPLEGDDYYRYIVVFGLSQQSELPLSTTITERQFNSSLEHKLSPPNAEFIHYSQKLHAFKPFVEKVTKVNSAGAELVKVDGTTYCRAQQEILLFSSPFLSDFSFAVEKVSKTDEEVVGKEATRQGGVFSLEKQFCQLQISGGTVDKQEYFAEITVVLQKGEFGQKECLQTAEDVLETCKQMTSEI